MDRGPDSPPEIYAPGLAGVVAWITRRVPATWRLAILVAAIAAAIAVIFLVPT